VRRHITLFAAAILIVGLPMTVAALAQPPGAGAATAGCAVTYTPNTWSTGFTADVRITNLGDPVTGWTLGFSFPGDQHITSGWSATYSQTGRAVTARSVDYNGALATGASTSIGFQATYTGTNAAPTAFTLNGVGCTGAPGTGSPTPTPTPTATTPTTPPPPPGTAPNLSVSGNRLVTGTGATYRLLGVNRSGGEFACIQGNGMWNGPMDQASVTAIRSWKVRTVRVPLNEECWLGTADVPAGGYSGAQYQRAVKDYVALLLANGITPLLELHWNYGQYTGPSAGCADVKATCQKPMPDAQYAPRFWTGVATAFKDTRIVFDLFNEPYPERATGSAASGWACWRDGGTCAGIPYQVAGFQSLVTAVRATGNANVILLGGLAYSNDLSQWLTYAPTDPLNNLAAFAHVYNFNSCSNVACYDSQLAPVAAKVPLTLSEIGENDCGHGFVDTLMTWADAHQVGYLGWTWNNWDCSTGPALVTDWTGTPTPYGVGLRNRLGTVSN